MTLAAVAFAFVLSGLIIWLIGGDPVRSFGHIVRAAFGSVGVISDTLVKATPLILTGLACSLAFRMRLWNIGAEGQFLLGAWGASAIVLPRCCRPGTPAIVVIPVMMLAGAAAGGLWGFIPGVLRARLGVNEIITTLMLNYVALFWVQFWVFGPWSKGGFQQTEAVPARGRAAPPDRLRRPVPALGGLTTHLGLVFGLVAAGDHVVRPRADPLGLRDPAHRRQPARRALRRDRHRPQDHRGLRRSRGRWPGWPG